MTRERWITLLVVSAATAMLLLDVTLLGKQRSGPPQANA